MKSQLIVIPKVSIHPDRICVYNEINWLGGRPTFVDQETGEIKQRRKFEHLLTSDRSANGFVSEQARRKMGKAIDYLLYMAADKSVNLRNAGKFFNFRIAFITLTLPSKQIHNDNEIKNKCLNSFILELKNFYRVRNYVWRAEKQANGNLHFHIIIDRFVPWSELRDRWNRIVNKLGYVDRYQDSMREWHKLGFKVRKDLLQKWDYEHQLHAYQTSSKTGFNNPNSTDIHSIKKVKNLKAYVSKYMSKNEKVNKPAETIDSEPLAQTGRIWGCNHELSNLTGAQTELDWVLSDELERVAAESECRHYKGDYFSVYYITIEVAKRLKAREVFARFAAYLVEHFDYHEQLILT